MAEESKKVYDRFKRYLTGKGVDIGCGPAPITPDCKTFDLEDGDAQTVLPLEEGGFDWVFSSHCLEHMRQPEAAIQRWWSLVKEGGYLLLVVPDEDLYEQGIWPSVWNGDHKYTFSPSKSKSWSTAHKNLADLVRLLPGHKLIRLEIRDDDYDHSLFQTDQTLGKACAHIELVVQKVTTPAPLRSTLENVIGCPQCGQTVLLVGRSNKSFFVRCSDCGTPGTFTL